MRTSILALFALACSACTATEDPGPGPDPADPGAPDAAEVLAEVDAAPPDAAGPPTVPQETSIETDVQSCTAACAQLGVGCAANCEEGATAGRANYGYFDWDFGFTRIVESVVFARCDELVAD